MDPVVVASVVTLAGTVAVGLGGAVLGRKWGLPGLGREVQQQQAALIVTLQAELAELRTQQTADAAQIATLTGQVARLKEELERAEGKIEKQRLELLSLYRQTGKTVPNAF